MGLSTVQVCKVVEECKECPVEDWYHMDRNSGEIHVRMSFTSLLKETVDIERLQETCKKRGLLHIMIHEVNMGTVEVSEPVLTVEVAGQMAHKAVLHNAGTIWKVGREFTFYTNNIETDKVTIQLINQFKSVGIGRCASTLLYKGMMIILTEGTQPFHPKREALEFDYYRKHHIMAQASKKVLIFHG